MKKQLGLALAAGLATSAVLVGTGGSANAAGPTNVAFAVSNNAANATGVTYTWNFTTDAALASSDTIQFSLPAGVAQSGGTVTKYGLGGCTTSPSVSGTTLTLTLGGTCSVSSGTSVSVALDGFTNPSTAIASFASTVTTTSGTGTAAAISIASDQTQVEVVVPESLTFTNDATSIQLLPIPGAGPVTAPDVNLGVTTNASGGYVLSACMTTANVLTNSNGDKIAAATNGSDLTSDYGFGASATDTPGTGADGTTPTTITYSNGWGTTSGVTDVNGYGTDCTSGSDTVASDAAPTDGDTITLSNSVAVAGTQAAGDYNGKIQYKVTPNF